MSELVEMERAALATAYYVLTYVEATSQDAATKLACADARAEIDGLAHLRREALG